VVDGLRHEVRGSDRGVGEAAEATLTIPLDERILRREFPLTA
jgi:hypothetical protein